MYGPSVTTILLSTAILIAARVTGVPIQVSQEVYDPSLLEEVNDIQGGLQRMYRAFHMKPNQMKAEFELLDQLADFKFDIERLKRSGGQSLPPDITLDAVLKEDIPVEDLEEYYKESVRLLDKSIALTKLYSRRHPEILTRIMSSQDPNMHLVTEALSGGSSRQKRQLKYLKKVVKQLRYFTLRDTMANNIVVSVLLTVFAAFPNTAIELSEMLVE